MKDFANSYKQKEWEFSCASHKRACEVLKFLEGKEYESLTKHLEYWKDSKDREEKRFPVLKNVTY